MSHLLTGTKFSDFSTFVFSVPWFRGSARSCHVSFHSVKYLGSCPRILEHAVIAFCVGIKST